MITAPLEQSPPNYNKGKLSPYTIQKQLAREKAERYFRKHYTVENSTAVHSSHTNFLRTEMLLGNVLGKGAFGIVWEVVGICLENSFDSSLVDGSRPDAGNRKFLAQHCNRSPNQLPQQQQQRYAMKTLSRATVKDKNLLCQGLVGLAVEARLLSQMEPHPHIIKLRAVADSNPFHEDFFIIIDRLYGTLEDRINDWKSQEQQQQQQQPKVAALWNVLSSERRIRCQQERLRLWEPRYQACHDLASALEHLHHHRIVHRDIKPQNIGYNIRGDLTLFDFGLSRELPSQQDQDGLYKMTGYCGSPRYMAPENANRQPYNEKCDVYSFALLAWQILTLQKPFEGHQMDYMKDMVWKKPFARPELARLRNHGKLQSLIDISWSHNWKERPTMREIRTTFGQKLISICDGDANGLSPRGSIGRNRRRSTYVFPLENNALLPIVVGA